MYTANGNATILSGTGYDLTKIPGSQTLANPGVVKMKDGVSSGMLNASVKRPSGAKSFLYKYMQDPIDS